MKRIYSSHPSASSEEISRSGKDFTTCEKTSQLRNAVCRLIKSCGLSKGEIAHQLGVAPSMVSMWLDQNGEGRPMNVRQAQRLLKIVKPQPRIILEHTEEVEAAIEHELALRFGPNAKEGM